MFNKLSIITFWIYLMPLGIICATAVVFFYNTLYIAFNFIIILAIAASIVFCLRAEFLAYTILIVYIGAIAILFLFVIMMLNLKINLNSVTLTALSTWETCITFFLVIKIIIVSKIMLIPNIVSSLGKGLIWSNFWNKSNIESLLISDIRLSGLYSSKAQVEILGELLYIDFIYLFIMVGIILLVSMVGALVLTTSKNLITT